MDWDVFFQSIYITIWFFLEYEWQMKHIRKQ